MCFEFYLQDDMNSHIGGNSENNSANPTCFGRPRERAAHTFALTLSTLIFATSMILTVYLTHKASMDRIVAVLIVTSCLLYLLGFASNMYSIYYGKTNSATSQNDENPSRVNQTTETSAQSSTRGRPPDVVAFSRAREPIRNTPPPPYEVQMSEMSRMLLPGASGTTDSTTRDKEITAEARKLIRRMYEEIKRVDQQVEQSPRNELPAQQMVQTPRNEQPDRQMVQTPRNEQPAQQMVQTPRNEQPAQQMVLTPKTPVRKQKMLPKVSQPNLVVHFQEAAVRSIPGCGFTPADIRTNQATQQQAASNSIPTQLDLQRMVIGSVECTASLPQLSPQREDILQVARRRKLNTLSKESEKMAKTRRQSAYEVVDGNDTHNNTYDPIEAVGKVPRTKSSQAAYGSAAYYCLDSESDDSPEQTSSACSAASEQELAARSAISEQALSARSADSGPDTADRKRKFQNPNSKLPRQLSAPSTRKFLELGLSPETVLDGIATCFDLTPDEWMAAWKLAHRGVSPIGRARILGVRLHENPYKGGTTI